MADRLQQEVNEYKARVQTMEFFEEFLLGINKKLDLMEVGKYITQRMKSAFNVKECALIVDDQRFTSEETVNERHVKTEQALFMGVLQRKKPMVIEDIKNDALFHNLKNEEEWALVAMPLWDEEGFSAVLYLYDEKGTLHEGALHMLYTFVMKATPSIANVVKYNILKKKSSLDFLTGVFNRGHFMERLQYEMSRMKKYLSLIMVDADFFKNYNDMNGHIAGDLLLKELAGVIKKSLRPSDVMGRYGGEEFIIVLPEVEKEGAVEVCERLRKAVESYDFPNKEAQPFKRVTVSIGVTTTVTKLKVEQVIHEADKQLYNAKNGGRNKVCSSVMLQPDLTVTL